MAITRGSALLVAVLGSASMAAAQVNTAAVLGRVTDPSDAVIPGAKVTVRNTATNLERSAATDAEGNFLFASVAAGVYEITVESPGMASQTRRGLVLGVGDRVRLDFAMKPGQVSQEITVSGTTPLINTVSPELGNLIDSNKVETLPINGRDFTQLVSLQAGVASSNVNGRNSFNLNGLTQWGVNISMDGTDASFAESSSFGDPSGRSVLNTVSMDTIEEFRVQAGTFTAETGRASGGAVNIITRGGTNDYHGVLYYYMRNSALDARNFFAATKNRLVQNQGGGNFGGPLIKDKLFFFGSYELSRRRLGQQLSASVPTEAFRAAAPAVYQPYLNLLPLPSSVPAGQNNTGVVQRGDIFMSDENLGNIRLDYNTSRSMSMVRYSINKSSNSVPNIIPKNRQAYDITNHLVTISNTFNFSPTTLNEVRLGFDRWDVPRLNTTFYNGLGEIDIAGVLNAGNFEGLLHFVDNSYTYADNLTHRAGKHNLKTGFEFRRLQSGRIQKQNPIYTYNSISDFMNNVPLSVRIIFGQPGIGLRQWNTGLFFQDDYQVAPHLTLNLGLRWEYYTPVSEVAGRLYNVADDPFGAFLPRGSQIYKPDYNNFNPRIGFAWDISGKQTTVLRGGYGIYSSPLTPIFVWDTPTLNPQEPVAFNAAPSDIPGLSYPLSGAIAQGVANPTQAAQLGLLPAVVARRIVDPNLRDTYSQQWDLTLQRALSKNFVLETSYVGNLSLKNVNTRSVNLIDPALKHRPVRSIGEILIIEDSGRRTYEALQVALRGRNVKGLTTDVYYTWSHSLVYGGDDCCTGTNTYIQDFNNIAASRGNANTDIRHALTFDYSWEVPLGQWFPHGPKALVKGWAIQGITRLRTGLPLTVFSGRDIYGNGIGNTQRVNYVGGDIYPSNQGPANFLNKAAFALPPAGTFGNIARNSARGPSFNEWDMSLIKNTFVFRETAVQFRAEVFNVANHTNFDNPVNSFVNPLFGRITSAEPARAIQLSLRYQF